MKTMRTILAAAVLAVTTTVAVHSTPANAAAPAVCNERPAGGNAVAYGLTADQRLVCFKVNRPWAAKNLMVTSDLSGGDSILVGIDVRPASGAIYGLGDAGGIYVLDPRESRPTFKARLNVALDGKNFGMDFNPTVDRLRVVSDRGQNLRINVDTGATTVDQPLKIGTNRINGVAAVAYTNNDNDATTATTLFDLDSVNDQLVTQAPPNDGNLVAVNALRFRSSADATFDIETTTKDGAIENTGYVALDGGEAFFRLDLKTASLTFLGNMGANRLSGLAMPI
jgi:hypothetical protein